MEKVASPVKFASTSFMSARFSYQQVTGFNQELQKDGTITIVNGWVLVSLWGGEMGAMLTISGTQSGAFQLVYVPRFCDKIVPLKHFVGSRTSSTRVAGRTTQEWLEAMVEDIVRDLIGTCRDEDQKNLRDALTLALWA